MMKMDFSKANGHARRDNTPFLSPYVEISGGNYDSFSPVGEGGSINNFLAEAEIISPSFGDVSPEQNVFLVQERMRKKLAYHFMNPIEKWREKGRFPWKLCVQVVKILFVTVQLILFGLHSYKHVQQQQDMTTTLSRIFLLNWSEDVAVYPPSTGPYAVYTIPEFYENIDHTIQQFTKITDLAIGSYSYDSPNGSMSPIQFCTKFYDGHVFPSNLTIKILSKPREHCIKINSSDLTKDDFSLQSFLNDSNFTINFKTLVKAKLNFSLKTIFLKSLSVLDTPECYHLTLTFSYDNTQHDGLVPISFTVHSNKVSCNLDTNLANEEENRSYVLRQLLNSIVIVLCVISGILCLRSLHSGYRVGGEADTFFKRYYEKNICAWELIDFIDFWYVMIVISDILLLFGSLIKIQIEERSGEGMQYSKCSILIGVGNLLIWAGLLRYLGFFPKYNMLILTLKRAMPNVLRFVLCAVFLYLGFCFCGWIVLAPYHIKFRSLSTTSECLFSVMNGDDMFATFALTNTQSDLIWWFSRIYLYAFLVLFIYVVISLFISVIMDTFETIKSIYLHGAPPKTTVEIFLAAKYYTAVSPNAIVADEGEQVYEDGAFKRFLEWLRKCFSQLFSRLRFRSS